MSTTAELETLPNRVAATMDQKEILLTGATGFLGKVLLEKLLRSCQGLRKVNVLVRTKKGNDPAQRLSQILASPLFDKVKAECGDEVLRKVTAVAGDVSAPSLGLHEEDRRRLCDSVSVVFHCAASVRFDEPLQSAILLNVRGTKLLLDLAEDMRNLQCFVYVSTAYCHPEQKVLEEKVYPCSHDPHKVIKFAESMEPNVINSTTKSLLRDIPNTYTFTKALAEALCEERLSKLPILIVRPSIVIPILREPLPGWTDNMNGPTGLLIGAGKGVIRTMYCDQNIYADYLPVDIAVNAIIIVVWNYIVNGDREQNVFNLTSSSEFKVTWAKIIEVLREVNQVIPFNNVVWYPGGSLKTNRMVHLVCLLLFQLIPAYFIDSLIYLAGYKPVLTRVQKRILKGFEMFEYYANHQWEFRNERALNFRRKLNSEESRVFSIEAHDFDIRAYLEDCARGARLYLLKEPPSTLPAARRHLKVMYYVDVVAKLISCAFFLWFFFSCSRRMLFTA